MESKIEAIRNAVHKLNLRQPATRLLACSVCNRIVAGCIIENASCRELDEVCEGFDQDGRPIPGTDCILANRNCRNR